MKKNLIIMAAGVVLLGVGLPVWASTQGVTSESSTSITSRSTSTNKPKETSTKLFSSKLDNSSAEPEDALSKNQNEFNAQAIQQNFYLKTVSNAGEVSYKKSTEDTLKALESERGTNDLKVTQVQYQGESITVID